MQTKDQQPESLDNHSKDYAAMIVNAVRVHMQEKGIKPYDLACMIALDEGLEMTEYRMVLLQNQVSRFLNGKKFHSKTIQRIFKHLQINEIRIF